MFATKDNERLFLASWEYNVSRTLEALADIVTVNGGELKPALHTACISNRTLSSWTRELKEKLEKLEALEPTEARSRAILEYRDKLEALETIDNKPVTVRYMSYVIFTLDGMYYQIDIADNPFFPHHFRKTPIANGTYSNDACLEEIPCTVAYDCMMQCTCSQEDRIEIANLIYNAVVTAKNSPIMRDSKRIRVYNTYDGGYHYETVTAPERRGKIDF